MLTKINNFNVKKLFICKVKKKIKTNRKKGYLCIFFIKILNKMLTLI